MVRCGWVRLLPLSLLLTQCRCACQAEDRLWFHITRYTTSSVTDADAMARSVEDALLAMFDVCHNEPGFEKAMSGRIYKFMRPQ